MLLKGFSINEFMWNDFLFFNEARGSKQIALGSLNEHVRHQRSEQGIAGEYRIKKVQGQ